MCKNFLSLICFLFLFSVTISGQKLSEFSAVPSEYLEQLKEFMTSSKQKKMEDAFEAYEDQFKAGVFADEEFNQIIKTSNAMLQFKMRPAPYFIPYLSSLVKVKKLENGEQKFKDWHIVLDEILANIEGRKIKPYQQYLEFSDSFFEHRTFREPKAGVNWMGIADEFKMEYQDKKPIVVYDKVDIQGFRKKDTITINNTKGIYYPVTLQWEGQGGQVNWKRFGESVDIVATLDTYKIEIKKSLFRVSKATLEYPDLFGSKKVAGNFEDKIMAIKNKADGSYPRFQSAEQVLEINDIGDGIRYKGGFKLNGTTVYGYGTKENKAKIIIEQDNKKRFQGQSENFVIRKGERIASERTEMTIYLDQDSIFHPSVNIKFDILKQEMQLFRGQRGNDRNPFFASQQNMNINVDKLLWKMSSDSLLLGTSAVSFSNASNVEFESLHYFEEADMRRIQNISTSNPITAIRQYADQEGVRQVDANGLAKKINPKYDVTSIQSLLYDLVAQGFVNYDSEDQIVTVKDKVYHYTNASSKKVDYDILKIKSKSDKTNAVLNLKNNTIDVQGVERIEFSPVQQVAAKPFNENLVLGKNRDIDFDGRVFAGFGILEGKNMHYTYDQNHITIDSVRYFDLFIPTGAEDENGKPEALSISSRIEHGNGILLIDAPENKSGKEELPMFPSYNTKGPSYVFYDYQETLNRVYKRDSFYFELAKFSFNQLDDFTQEDVTFKGEMYSSDIFPVFKETVVVREEDASLGFVTNTGPGGYPAYSQKGKYRGEIDLSNKGFFGKGNIQYLGASMDSEDLIFRPKQMTGTAKRFDLTEDRNSAVKIPQAVGIDVSIDWKPYQDSMYIRSKEESFKLFKADNYTVDGTLILTPDGLKAKGKFEWEKGILASKLMSFGAFSVTADTSNLKIKAFEGEFAFDTENVNADLDFDTQRGEIIANEDGLTTTMPYNQYQTSMGELDWDMAGEKITFKNKNDRKYGDFVSIHPDQDSLNFEAESATYDLKTNELKIGGVPRIQTCDAYVYTETGDIEIKKGGVMSTLSNAKITASLENEYHVINRATVDIKGKKDYTAKGYYEYNIGDRQQEIYFADIVGARIGKGNQTTKPTETRAKGEIKADDNFYIDAKTQYQGTITLNANDKNLDFDGFAKLDAPLLPNREWFTVRNKADKKDLVISFDTPKNFAGEPLRTGIFLSKEQAIVYPRMMQPTHLRKDRALLDAKGVFKYNKKNDTFIFGDSTNVVSDFVRGDRMEYNVRTNAVSVSGKLNLGSNLDYVKVDAAGTAETAFPGGSADQKFKAEVMAGIMMKVPEKLLKIMVTDLVSSSFDARPINYTADHTFYKKALAVLIEDDKSYKNTLARTSSLGLELPKKNNKYAFVFSKMPMKWDVEYQSMVTSDNESAVGVIGGTPINRILTCHVEFKMPSNGDDRIYIYIKSPSDYYYYFGYKQGILDIGSSNTRFEDELLGMKTKELSVKMPDGEKMEIQAVEAGKARSFVNRIQATRNR